MHFVFANVKPITMKYRENQNNWFFMSEKTGPILCVVVKSFLFVTRKSSIKCLLLVSTCNGHKFLSMRAIKLCFWFLCQGNIRICLAQEGQACNKVRKSCRTKASITYTILPNMWPQKHELSMFLCELMVDYNNRLKIG